MESQRRRKKRQQRVRRPRTYRQLISSAPATAANAEVIGTIVSGPTYPSRGSLIVASCASRLKRKYPRSVEATGHKKRYLTKLVRMEHHMLRCQRFGVRRPAMWSLEAGFPLRSAEQYPERPHSVATAGGGRSACLGQNSLPSPEGSQEGELELAGRVKVWRNFMTLRVIHQGRAVPARPGFRYNAGS
jgi:hypothetical protein